MMNRKCLFAANLAYKDWLFEKSLSFCAILALASMLVPLLSLMGLKNGVISTMRERLLEDPAILVITPKSDAGRHDAAFIASLAELPGATFAIGRIRDTATDITLASEGGPSASIGLEPASAGEPLLSRYGLPSPPAGAEPGIVLTTAAARALNAQLGETLGAKLGRRTPRGKFESENLDFRVTGILPVEAGDRKLGFVSLKVLEDMEDYRDYIAVPERNFDGREKSGPRNYASFRLYAKNLDAVETLAAKLAEMKIETITRAREIAGIRHLEAAINQIILIISLAVGAGFVAFTLSSGKGAVARKQRMLGMLRLLGFPHLALTIYPVVQALLTALCGLALSLALYLAVSYSISHAFSGQGALSCRLGFWDIILATGAVLVFSILATASAAYKAGNIEPSSVIRDN